MKLPDYRQGTVQPTVKIGHKIYKLEYVDNLKDLGDCDPDELRIRIRTNLPEAIRRSTILHEILHACWNYVGLPEDIEERTIDALDDILFQALHDNPDLY